MKPEKIVRKWTDEEHQRALDMRAKGMSDTEIGSVLGRSRVAVNNRLSGNRPYWNDRKQRPSWFKKRLKVNIDVPPEVLADRDHRSYLVPRDLTAAVMGDPPIGYSALERRT